MTALLERSLAPISAVQAFEAIVRLGSVTRAARELGVTAGAISQRIKQLEEYLGVRLFERRGQGVVPTAWGRTYLPGVSAGFAALRQAEAMVEQRKRDARIG